ncbi:transcription factor SPT20 homolog isoform X2 [Oppia nitens]|uniref:transcription factor SPT20 homolog isoform X2 n=1 Tax=Oppia nitens TaxID=1686743 RepID=UPI0023DB4603|nr:transcription factor SPT20 homolog isoform X2 [Oppia nitens]
MIMATKNVDQMFSLAEHYFELSQNDWTQLRSKDSKDGKHGSNQNKSIDDRLLDLMLEDKHKANKQKNLTIGSFILKKLVLKEKLNHFVVCLYSASEGYSIGLKLADSDGLIETMRLPYDEYQLLDYIDNEELPPFLVDFIESSPLINCNLFQSGCLIFEVRDFRRSAPSHSHHYSSHWVLLRPTTQSLTNDILSIINNSSDEYYWTNEDKAELESQLLMATTSSLCLDPSPAVAILSNKLWRKKRLFRDGSILKLSKKCSQLASNRQKKFDSLPAPPSLRLHEFLKKRNTKTNSHSKVNKPIHVNINEPIVESIPVKDIDVHKFAKELPKPLRVADNSLIKVEEYSMDFIDDNRRSLTNVTILHRPIDDTYFGQLFIDRQGHIRGSTSTFCLGTKQSTKRYVEQFTEILTENGRKSVKIVHQIAGQVPQVSYTSAAAAQGIAVNAIPPNKEAPVEEENTIAIRATPPKKPKLVTVVEQSPPIQNTTTILQSHIISPTIQTVPSVAPKPVETTIQTIPTVFSAPNKITTDTQIATPLLTTGIHATTTTATIPESALTVIFTPTSGIAKSIQQIECTTDGNHQSITTSTPLPTGVSLASLSLAPVQQNLRLHNLVSLTPGGLAVPISLTMMPTASGTQSSIMTSAGSMIVSLDHTGQHKEDNVTVTYAAAPTTVLMSTGAPGSNVVSVPIGMAGSLGVQHLNAQIINQLKQNTGQIRTAGPTQVSLLQMSNTSTVPLLRPLAPHTYAPSSSNTTFTTIQSIPHSTPTLAAQQHFTNALRKQVQQTQQIAPQKPQRKRQTKK